MSPKIPLSAAAVSLGISRERVRQLIQAGVVKGRRDPWGRWYLTPAAVRLLRGRNKRPGRPRKDLEAGP